MKLSYRGLSYETKPQTIETVESSISAKYRGLNYCIRRPSHSVETWPNIVLRFRGSLYNI